MSTRFSNRFNTSQNVERLAISAMLLALGTVLSAIPIISMPMGGSVTLVSMLPIVIIAYMYGFKWALGCSFVFAVLNFATSLGLGRLAWLLLPNRHGEMDFSFVSIVLILMLDYLIAYTVLAAAALTRNAKKKGVALACGSVLAIGLRFVAHFVSGAIFFGHWAEWGFSQIGAGDWFMERFSGTGLILVYSFVYNISYMGPEVVLTALAALGLAYLPVIEKKDVIRGKKMGDLT